MDCNALDKRLLTPYTDPEARNASVYAMQRLQTLIQSIAKDTLFDAKKLGKKSTREKVFTAVFKGKL